MPCHSHVALSHWSHVCRIDNARKRNQYTYCRRVEVTLVVFLVQIMHPCLHVFSGLRCVVVVVTVEIVGVRLAHIRVHPGKLIEHSRYLNNLTHANLPAKIFNPFSQQHHSPVLPFCSIEVGFQTTPESVICRCYGDV